MDSNFSKPLILINRYDRQNTVRLNYRRPIEDKITYVQELPASVKNRLNKRPKSNKNIKHNNRFYDYKNFTIKPSQLRCQRRTAHPFRPLDAEEKFSYKTEFPVHYWNKEVPCHINHKNSFLTLQWEKPFSEIRNLPTVAKVCFMGIEEKLHPYKFIARQACKDLLRSPGAKESFREIMDVLYLRIRNLLYFTDDELFYDVLEICKLLVLISTQSERIYVRELLEPLNKRIVKHFIYIEKIYDLLMTMEKVFGKDIREMIVRYIPNYKPETI